MGLLSPPKNLPGHGGDPHVDVGMVLLSPPKTPTSIWGQGCCHPQNPPGRGGDPKIDLGTLVVVTPPNPHIHMGSGVSPLEPPNSNGVEVVTPKNPSVNMGTGLLSPPPKNPTGHGGDTPNFYGNGVVTPQTPQAMGMTPVPDVTPKLKRGCHPQIPPKFSGDTVVVTPKVPTESCGVTLELGVPQSWGGDTRG